MQIRDYSNGAHSVQTEIMKLYGSPDADDRAAAVKFTARLDYMDLKKQVYGTNVPYALMKHHVLTPSATMLHYPVKKQTLYYSFISRPAPTLAAEVRVLYAVDQVTPETDRVHTAVNRHGTM